LRVRKNDPGEELGKDAWALKEDFVHTDSGDMKISYWILGEDDAIIFWDFI
jgi:hypothetical protein